MCLENALVLCSLSQATAPCSAVKSRATVTGTILCLFTRCHVSVVIFAAVKSAGSLGASGQAGSRHVSRTR